MAKTPTAAAKRDCRPCRVCCTYLAIPAGAVAPGGKPAGVACPHQRANGCRIYSQRPTLCADFCCPWLSDESWPERWRPDHSGLMCLREEIEEGLLAALIYEIRPGALQESLAVEITEELRRSTAIVVVVDNQNRRTHLLGKWKVHPPESAVSPPHFLGRQHREPEGSSPRARKAS